MLKSDLLPFLLLRLTDWLLCFQTFMKGQPLCPETCLTAWSSLSQVGVCASLSQNSSFYNAKILPVSPHEMAESLWLERTPFRLGKECVPCVYHDETQRGQRGKHTRTSNENHMLSLQYKRTFNSSLWIGSLFTPPGLYHALFVWLFQSPLCQYLYARCFLCCSKLCL